MIDLCEPSLLSIKVGFVFLVVDAQELAASVLYHRVNPRIVVAHVHIAPELGVRDELALAEPPVSEDVLVYVGVVAEAVRAAPVKDLRFLLPDLLEGALQVGHREVRVVKARVICPRKQAQRPNQELSVFQ